MLTTRNSLVSAKHLSLKQETSKSFEFFCDSEGQHTYVVYCVSDAYKGCDKRSLSITIDKSSADIVIHDDGF